jgi:radial spoke head protein 9
MDSDDEVIKVQQLNFTELDRLAFVVNAIEVDCQLLPVGALKLDMNH